MTKSLSLSITPVTRKKSKKHTRQNIEQNNLKKAKQMCKGLQIMWSDLDPETESRDPNSIFNKHVSHVNPVYRLICNDIWDNYKDWILSTEFTWAFRVEVIYESNRDQKLKKDIADFKLTFVYKNNHAMENAARDFIFESRMKNHNILEEFGPDHKSYGRYIQTDFIAEIVGV